MNQCNPTSPYFSSVTNTYLTEYASILNDMIREMSAAAFTDSISHNFIVQMIPHHRAAIRMSQNILKYTTNIPLQSIAEGIISEQTKSIADMQSILNTCERQTNPPSDVYTYQSAVAQIIQTMFSRMTHATATNQINADFIREMIPHHEGAVRMSENVLRFDICPQLRPAVQAILTSQERGIRQMQYLLQCMDVC